MLRMVRLVLALLALWGAAPSSALSATLGTVVPLVGGATDMVLDQDRQRLYFVNVPNQIAIYSIAQRRYLTPIRTDDLPLAAAMSRSGRFLYVTCHNASSINVIDLDTLAIVRRVSLPARPEGIAVGADERVLITTIGTGQGNQFNVLLLLDPNPNAPAALSAIPVTPAPPTPPQLSPPSGRVFLTNRSALATARDGRTIIGLILPNNANRSVFVYESASGTIVRSRTVTGVSNVLAVAPDASRFMAGLSLFDTQTLEVMAQQNLANASYPVPAGTNFNTQINQGGAVFSQDGNTLYTAFNVAPIQNPPARANVSQMMINDPDNLLIQEGIQLPENLSGKMEIGRDGNIYALSESGFVIIPIGTLSQNPLARPDRTAIALASDQCALPINKRTDTIVVRNAGRGNLGPVSAQLLNNTQAPGGLGGAGGPGGGAPGGGVVILPGGGIPGLPGGGAIQLPGFGGALNQINAQQNALIAAAPTLRTTQSADGTNINFTFNATNARTLGTAPLHDFLVSSNNAVNIPARVRVYQNSRNTETRGDVYPLETGTSNNEGLTDLVYDAFRQRVYIANSGMNRVEVFDVRTRRLMNSIKVGQLPRSMALALDGSVLYVANTGGESISIVNPDRGVVTGKVKYPPIPFNANFALVTPSVLAMSQRGLLVVMNNGTLWRVVGDDLVPRSVSPIIGTTTLNAPRTMASTPNGENVILMTGNGFVYLYDALADEFVQGRQIFTTAQTRAGYYGALAAGPRGQYFLVNGTVLNQSLTPVFTATTLGAVPANGQLPTAQNMPISSVIPVGASNFLRLTLPVATAAQQAAAGGRPVAIGGAGAAAAVLTVVPGPTLELVDINSGIALRRWDALEGPVSTASTTQQVNIDGRTIAIDPAGTTAFVLSASGLNVLALDTPTPANERPLPNQNGVVSNANYGPALGQGSLMSVFGRNLGTTSAGSETPLPLMANVCVTLNNNPMQLFAVTPGQINAQVPFELAPGRYPLIVRSVDKRAASNATTIQIAKYAPAVFVDPEKKIAAIYHADGTPVLPDKPTTRDRRLTIYATGLGPTKPAVATGAKSPANALTDKVQVFFGNPTITQAEVVVESSKLVPGRIGIYEIHIYVPGDRLRGKTLPVTIRVGGVSSSVTQGLVPTVAVE